MSWVSHNRVEELSRKNKNMAAISCQSPVYPLIFADYCIRPTDFLWNQMGKLKIATSAIIQVQYKDMDKELCCRWTTVPGKRGIIFWFVFIIVDECGRSWRAINQTEWQKNDKLSKRVCETPVYKSVNEIKTVMDVLLTHRGSGFGHI